MEYCGDSLESQQLCSIMICVFVCRLPIIKESSSQVVLMPVSQPVREKVVTEYSATPDNNSSSSSIGSGCTTTKDHVLFDITSRSKWTEQQQWWRQRVVPASSSSQNADLPVVDCLWLPAFSGEPRDERHSLRAQLNWYDVGWLVGWNGMATNSAAHRWRWMGLFLSIIIFIIGSVIYAQRRHWLVWLAALTVRVACGRTVYSATREV